MVYTYIYIDRGGEKGRIGEGALKAVWEGRVAD